MKQTTEKAAAARGTRHALCKRLAEDYPEHFARWLFVGGAKSKSRKPNSPANPFARMLSSFPAAGFALFI
ncbi:MAG TPA: hypothetical protein VFZ34_32740 [Blastocatellia bacterium]|nr:hypothetical protein [Blastocatellia bacterium]